MKAKIFTLRAITTAIVTLMIGALLSLEFDDWGWFSRSGSLVVINGIILTSHQIIQHMHNLSQYQQQRQSQFQRDWAHEDKHHLIRDDSENRWKSEKYGLYMLIVGTVVWGFGDLLNRI
ncbi:MAG: hypothetical protein OQK78_00265 [Gammaproteobacteria bacterium]|nr:hypothetical protein [Gammaproteobacteria bacterium]